MNKQTQIKTNDWFSEISWLNENYEKWTADDLKLICYARQKETPKPAPNLANVLRSAVRQGLVEPVDQYSKSRWIKSNRIPRQFWRKPKRRKVS